MAKKFLPVLLFFLIAINFTYSSKTVLAFDCLTLKTTSSEEDKNYCKKELAQIEAELKKLLDLQKEQQKKTGTLIGDVNYLTSQINALKTKIKSRSLVISQLKVAIVEKVSTIQSLNKKIEREHESIAQLLRNTNEFDNETLVHFVLSDESLSGFYGDLESYASIKEAVKASVENIKGVKQDTEVEKQDLEKKQDMETDAKVELENAQKKVALSEAEKKQLLAVSKQTEAAYQKLASEKKARADRIRAALFPLRDAVAIPFGTALQYAEEAQKKTGVRPAFVLAILKQETNLGANVGSCVITNLSSGETKRVDTGTIFPVGIHPTRDLPLLQKIVNELGRDPLTTRISCPQSVGYGGAMGPAQFIPSTWALIKPQIALALGKSIPDPWNPEDAIMASSILLRDNGAGSQTYTAERNAACKYFSGRGCSDPKVKNAFYGNNVMALAAKIQADIDVLQ
ncbi:lytic murein transglycosylase [Candidatus Nomurabacteria bacterium]|nr:lytic murein transglycosylase [Candidatus Nomurabacteria bacterium]